MRRIAPQSGNTRLSPHCARRQPAHDALNKPRHPLGGVQWLTQPRPGSGALNVYDVTLTVAGCVAPYDYLNAQYQGLATTTPSTVWDYDSLLRMWLSRAGGGSTPALTMLGYSQ